MQIFVCNSCPDSQHSALQYGKTAYEMAHSMDRRVSYRVYVLFMTEHKY